MVNVNGELSGLFRADRIRVRAHAQEGSIISALATCVWPQQQHHGLGALVCAYARPSYMDVIEASLKEEVFARRTELSCGAEVADASCVCNRTDGSSA